MRISDWSSDVCSSDLGHTAAAPAARNPGRLSRSGPVARVLAAGPLRGDSVMLPPWVSHCELDDQMIFLDVRRNRYWAMSAETGQFAVTGQFGKLRPTTLSQIERWGWHDPNAVSTDHFCGRIAQHVQELAAESWGVKALRGNSLAEAAGRALWGEGGG